MTPKNIEEQVKSLNEGWEALLIGISLAKVPDPLKMQLYSDVAYAMELAAKAVKTHYSHMLVESHNLKWCDVCEKDTWQIPQGTDRSGDRDIELFICTDCNSVNIFDVEEDS